MSGICVAHLVRARNGLEPFRNFLKSYGPGQGGVEHDLLIIYKGFAGRDAAEPFRAELKAFPHREFFVSDVGFDLRAYSLAARKFEYSHFCFLNSFSVLLDDDWLAKISALALRPETGLVGATGSYESMYTNLLAGEKSTQGEGQIFPGYLGRGLRLLLNRFFFPPFPNYHIRTNAMMLPRRVILKVWSPHILTKKSAYLFENGKRSLTQRVLRLGLKVLVTGRDGRAYEKEEWFRSNTYRQSNQENLLVADNQTHRYAKADYAGRLQLSRVTWGDQADPARP